MQTCLAYVDAQREYYDRNPLGGTLPQYARKISSSEGTKDGLHFGDIVHPHRCSDRAGGEKQRSP